MHKLLAAAALLAAMMVPVSVTEAKNPGLPCASNSMEASACAAGYDYDMDICGDMADPNLRDPCERDAERRYDRCMHSC